MTGLSPQASKHIIGLPAFADDQLDRYQDRVYSVFELEQLELDKLKRVMLLPDFRLNSLGPTTEMSLRKYPQSVLIRSSSVRLIAHCLDNSFDFIGQCGIFVDFLRVESDDLEYSVFYRKIDSDVEIAYIKMNNYLLGESIKTWFTTGRVTSSLKCKVPSREVGYRVLTTLENLIPKDLSTAFFNLYPYSMVMILAINHNIRYLR